MADERDPLAQRIDEGREAVADMGAALVDYLATVQRVVESASGASRHYQDLVALADAPLSAELGEKLRESVAQFANGSIAMATAFSQIMRTMKEAYDKIEASASGD